MTGLELSRDFFREWGMPMLEKGFPSLLPYLAAGLTGSGSECFGYDDEISRDHDFEPGFCLFLPGEDVVDRRSAFLLERAYARLPKEYRGFSRSALSPVGGARHGVFRTADYFLDRAGTADGLLTAEAWLALPEQALAEAVNGELYFDNYGEVTAIRQALAFYPEDVRLKRLAGSLLLAGQAGQYNYLRCLRRGETGAAQLAAGEFVRQAMSACFLLKKRYQPYYKWSFRALRELPGFPAELAGKLEALLSTGCGEDRGQTKAGEMEAVASLLCEELRAQGLSQRDGSGLEEQAYAVNDRIRDPGLRNLHILAGV